MIEKGARRRNTAFSEDREDDADKKHSIDGLNNYEVREKKRYGINEKKKRDTYTRLRESKEREKTETEE